MTLVMGYPQAKFRNKLLASSFSDFSFQALAVNRVNQ
jgi:hypothetical protein